MKLPTQAELTAYRAKIAANRALPPAIMKVLEELPKDAHAMDVLRTTASTLGCLEPEEGEMGKGDTAKTAERLMPVFVSALCYWHHFSNTGKRIAINVEPQDNLATAFMKMLRDDGKPADPLDVKTIDAAFILYAEHDFNASTFTSRVI